MPKSTAKPAATKAAPKPPDFEPAKATTLPCRRLPEFSRTPTFAQPDGDGSALYTAGRVYIGRLDETPEDVLARARALCVADDKAAAARRESSAKATEAKASD